MRITLNDLDHIGDALAAISAMTETLADPTAWDFDEHVFSKVAPAPAHDFSAEHVNPGQSVAIQIDDVIGDYRLVPCSRRGLHDRLVDCWMCWSDVHRGALTLADALRPSSSN